MDVRPGDEVLVRVEVIAIFPDPDWGLWIRVRSREPWGTYAYRAIAPWQVEGVVRDTHRRRRP